MKRKRRGGSEWELGELTMKTTKQKKRPENGDPTPPHFTLSPLCFCLRLSLWFHRNAHYTRTEVDWMLLLLLFMASKPLWPHTHCPLLTGLFYVSFFFVSSLHSIHFETNLHTKWYVGSVDKIRSAGTNSFKMGMETETWGENKIPPQLVFGVRDGEYVPRPYLGPSRNFFTVVFPMKYLKFVAGSSTSSSGNSGTECPDALRGLCSTFKEANKEGERYNLFLIHQWIRRTEDTVEWWEEHVRKMEVVLLQVWSLWKQNWPTIRWS